MLTNALIVSGVCLLPLAGCSTLDTIRKRRRRSAASAGFGV
jgi:hypothetical protein